MGEPDPGDEPHPRQWRYRENYLRNISPNIFDPEILPSKLNNVGKTIRVWCELEYHDQ